MLLNGTSSHAETAGAGGLTTGASARTLAAIINRTSSSGFRNVVSLLTSGNATVLDLTFNGTTLLAEAPGGGSNGPTVGTGKMYVALDKASGNATPRFHKQIYGTDTAVAHSAGSGSINDTGTIAKVGVGAFETSGDFFAGDIYVVAAWSRQLSDAEHELLAGSVAAWHELQPDWLIVELNAVLPSSLQDSSSNGGAPLSSLTSISASTTSMPVALGGPFIRITRPGAAASGGSDTPTPGTATGAGISPTASITTTPTVGQATAAGIAPSATIAATPTVGTSTGAGISPTASITTTPTVGTATGAGTSPTATITITPGPGTATGSGISPTDGSETSDTPTPGTCTGAGISPTASISATPTVGQATAAGITPSATLSATPTVGTATGSGITPAASIVATPTVGTANANGTSPAATVTITVTAGTATGSGISPFDPNSADTYPLRLAYAEAAHLTHKEPGRHITYRENHHLTT